MSNKRNSKKSSRKKVKEVKEEPMTQWKAVHELAITLDDIIRNAAATVLKVKDSLNHVEAVEAAHPGIVNKVSCLIIDSKEKVKTAVANMPLDAETEVSEDDYPDYLNRFLALVEVHEKILAELVPPLAELTLAVTAEERGKDDE